MRSERLNIIFCCCFIALFFSVVMRAYPAFSQKGEGLVLNGTVYNAATKKPVASGSVFVSEIKKGTAIDAAGRYAIIFPKQGTYTLIIQSDGLRPLRERININANLNRDFALVVFEVKDEGITITAKRDVQKLSHQTMTLEKIKEVPATFGDSINALTSLPGINHASGGFFGPLVIRGGELQGNRYLVDDIPMYSPLHYGGLESVINTNLLNEVNLYSSAFSAEFGSATAAIISMTTRDDVKRFGGYTDISALSANALIQTPILKSGSGDLSLGSPLDDRAADKTNVGYIIASGREGYYDLIVLPLVQLITGTHIDFVPKFWDYQFKFKYKFDDSNSITVLAIGSSDYLRFLNKPTSLRQNLLSYDLQAKMDDQTHGQSINYTFQPSDRFNNRLIYYSSLTESNRSVSIPAPGVNISFQDTHIGAKPYVFGFMDKFKIVAVNKYFDIHGGAEYTLYYFRSNTMKPLATSYSLSSDISQTNYVSVITDNRIINHKAGGYIEPTIRYDGLTIMPSFRTDYLNRTGQTTWDPRGLISYEFKSGTTISAAGGKYSNFYQTNPLYLTGSPEYASIRKDAPAEWAIHRVGGLEQTIKLFKIKVEGFYNNFYNLVQNYLHYGQDWELYQTMSTGRMRAYGAEVMLSLDKKENENGIFGWINYTYTRSQFRSGLPNYPYLYGIPYNNIGDLFGNNWLNYQYEINHSLKVVAGYVFYKHTFSTKFQFYTSNPYTPIVGSQQDTTTPDRFYPIHGSPNSRHFPPSHQLDIRYSNTTPYSWGHVTWYIEIIGVDAIFSPSNYQQTWNYSLPYLGSSNPKVQVPRNQLNFFPNFGVEVKF